MHSVILITIGLVCLYAILPNKKHVHSINPEDVLMFGEDAKCKCNKSIKQLGIWN